MSQVIKSVCVYCGASNGASENFLKIATDVGRALGENGIRLVYGGGGIGLMGAVADAALAAGGEVIGVIPEHLQNAELGHRGHELRSSTHAPATHDVRPPRFIARAHARDLTRPSRSPRQLGMHDKLIILVNHDDYWDPSSIWSIT
jgi:predicted Rossmann-fold nucleotide-binding protein